jgi:hypothetical protein
MKVLILNDKMRDKNIDLIKPRNIQISKEKKIKDLKEKIIRCIKEHAGYDEMAAGSVPVIKFYLFNFGMKENKKDTFELIYAYKNKLGSNNLIAEEITDDEMTLEVNIKF